MPKQWLQMVVTSESKKPFISLRLFFPKSQITGNRTFVFWIITFELTLGFRPELQNDRLNLSFVKKKSVFGKPMDRNGGKLAIYFELQVSMFA